MALCEVMWRAGLVWLVVGAAACGPSEQTGVVGTVELGDNFVAPDLQLDEAFFFCRIQPEVLTKHSCASGGSGEQGQCHDSRSALRLIATKDAPPCDAKGAVVRMPSADYVANQDAVRFFVQSDPLSSPLYLCPLNQASHPRKIFDDNDVAAKLIAQWISAGAK